MASLFKSLCLPSKVYFVLSAASILLTMLAPRVFGRISILSQVVHIIYVVFWTWILNLICKAGYKWISWVLVLAPIIIVVMLFSLVGAAELETQLI